MARIDSIYTFDNERFAALREPSRRVTASMQNAAKCLDALKEHVLIEMGLVNVSNTIHVLSHKMPPRWDKVGDWLHQRHLRQEFPATQEYTNMPETLDGVYEEVIRMLQDIDDALKAFITTADELKLYPLAREAENMQIINSEDYEKYLLAWMMYDEADASPTSFDNWIASQFKSELSELEEEES